MGESGRNVNESRSRLFFLVFGCSIVLFFFGSDFDFFRLRFEKMI